ncbi:MAG TPA: response regulator [Hyphomicrobiaceae bacterium]|nr:response regulator [Hyphomicrobiaceae bacterium]
MSKRILIVEDQEDNRAILRDLLSQAGYDLIEAADGGKGVELARSERPDLILMDIQLPVLDGYEATRQIKGTAELKSIPIIAVTSYALSGDEAKARAAGCDGYVTKPFSPRQLLAKVREFMPAGE